MRLHRDGTPVPQIRRECLPEFALSTLYLYLEPARGAKWTKAEDDTLMDLRGKGLTVEHIKDEAFPDKSSSMLKQRVRRLLALNPGTRNELLQRNLFTSDRIQQLERLHEQGVSSLEIADALGIVHKVVRAKMSQLKLNTVKSDKGARRTSKKWTQAEHDALEPYLAIRFSTRHFDEILKQIPMWRRSLHSTEERLSMLRRNAGITRDWRKWSPEQIGILLKLQAEGLTLPEIAEKLSRKVSDVRAKLNHVRRESTPQANHAH